MIKKELNILLIIPCFNEFKRLPVDEILNFLSNDNNNIQLLFVNDGSTDNTLQLLNKIKEESDRVSVLNLTKNVGKAEAVRTAMLKNSTSKYDYIGYFDADLATPLEEIYLFIDKITHLRPLLLMGSRVKLLGITHIERKQYRHYFGRVFATIVSNMLHLSVYDTQCGAKLINAKSIPQLFKEKFISSWLFDVEILFRTKKSEYFHNHHLPIIEIPLSCWIEKGDSKIPFGYLFKIPLELIKIFFKYRV